MVGGSALVDDGGRQNLARWNDYRAHLMGDFLAFRHG
jgi:hypothetical protein